MVNFHHFHDPVVERKDDGAYYSFTAVSESWERIDWTFSQVARIKLWLVLDGLFLWVSNLSLLQNISNLKTTFPAGSSSRLSTLSGVSCKDVAATGGQSGSVMITPCPWLLSSWRAVFSFHRSTPFRVWQPLRACLLTSLFLTSTPNMTVRCVPCFRLACLKSSSWLITPELSWTFALVGVSAYQALGSLRECSAAWFYLGLCIPGPCCCIVLACTPHVRLLPFSNTVLSQK